MSKMSEMEATIRELRDITSSINDILGGLITKPKENSSWCRTAIRDRQ